MPFDTQVLVNKSTMPPQHIANSLLVRGGLTLLCIALFGLALPYVAGPELLHFRPWIILFLLNAMFLVQFVTLALNWEKLKRSHELLQAEFKEASLHIAMLREQIDGAQSVIQRAAARK